MDQNQSLLPGRATQTITTHFKKPQRIMKSNSHASSSKPILRGRRITQNIPSRARSVTESSRLQIERPVPTRSRPVSWQPHFMAMPQQTMIIDPHTVLNTYKPQSNTAQYSVWPSDFQSYDTINNFQPHGATNYYPTNEVYSYNDTDPIPYATMAQLNFAAGQLTPASFGDDQYDSYSTLSESLAPSAPLTPAFLPLFDFETDQPEVDNSIPQQNKELVALGLYDSPAQVQFSRLTLSDGMITQPKAMKLEAAFSPDPSQNDSQEDTESDFSETPPEQQIGFQATMQSALTYAVPFNPFQSCMQPISMLSELPTDDNAWFW